MSIMMNWRKNCSCRKWLLATLILLAVFPSAFDCTAVAAPTPSPQAVPAQANVTSAPAQIDALDNATPVPAGRSPLEKLTAWDILWMCEEFTWPFIILTAIGLAFIIHRSLLEYRQKLRSQVLLARPIEYASLSQFVQLLNGAQASRAAVLFQQMITTFTKMRKADSLHDDIGNFMQGEKDHLDAFNRIITFLSDTAGALGLLGTVWGIFIVFYGGKMDGPTILRGMSVALITTLVGLLISLLLNLGLVSIQSLFNRQLKLISERAEKLRQVLLQYQLVASATSMRQEPPRPEPARPARPVGRPRRERRPEPVVVSDEAMDEWVWPTRDRADYTDGARGGYIR